MKSKSYFLGFNILKVFFGADGEGADGKGADGKDQIFFFYPKKFNLKKENKKNKIMSTRLGCAGGQ